MYLKGAGLDSQGPFYTGVVKRPTPFRLTVRVVTAVMIGVATIFIPKVDPKEHWSIPPTMERGSPAQTDHSGGPDL